MYTHMYSLYILGGKNDCDAVFGHFFYCTLEEAKLDRKM